MNDDSELTTFQVNSKIGKLTWTKVVTIAQSDLTNGTMYQYTIPTTYTPVLISIVMRVPTDWADITKTNGKAVYTVPYNIGDSHTMVYTSCNNGYGTYTLKWAHRLLWPWGRTIRVHPDYALFGTSNANVTFSRVSKWDVLYPEEIWVLA